MKKIMKMQGRQGDVYIRLPDSKHPLPKKSALKKAEPKNGLNILAYGEATGHHHSTTAECTTLYDVEPALIEQLFGKNADVQVLEVTTPTHVNHQTHGAIEIAEGMYWKVGQREYTPEEIKRVVD